MKEDQQDYLKNMGEIWRLLVLFEGKKIIALIDGKRGLPPSSFNPPIPASKVRENLKSDPHRAEMVMKKGTTPNPSNSRC